MSVNAGMRTATGSEYLDLVTRLTHRVRVEHPTAGLWEAADLQWWWRSERSSDQIAQQFWLDEGDQPEAAIILTDWSRTWGCDPIVLPSRAEAMLPTLWSKALQRIDDLSLPSVEIMIGDDDETLRDGLQNPSVTDPSIDEKIRLLHLMDELGIHTADIGLPGAGPRAVEDVRALAKEIATARLSIGANCAARTVRADIEPIARVSQEVGIPIEACTFIGSSPVRQYAEDWTLERMLRVTEDAVRFAVSEGLPVMYVTEDTTRARPETLKQLYGTAIAAGAKRSDVAEAVAGRRK